MYKDVNFTYMNKVCDSCENCRFCELCDRCEDMIYS